MGILALDPGTHFGWAWYDPATRTKESGCWRLGKAKATRGERFAQLMQNLKMFCATHTVAKIAIEGASLASAGSSASRSMTEAWIPLVELFCHLHKLPEPSVAAPASWRSAFIGCTKAPKDVQGTETRRRWLKEKTMERCRSRGSYPSNDNEADAIGILFWAVHGCDERLAKQRENRKQAKREKRRQQQLELV
jgi:Holliday junction resolvasome RuvABC endonuclease subunit